MGDFGWFTLFTDKDENGKVVTYPNAVVPAILMCMFLFVLPKEAKYYKDFANGGLAHGLKDPLLPWSEVDSKIPWGPLILIGGGVAISMTIKESGLDEAISNFLRHTNELKSLPPSALLAVILVIVACLTTVASNTATAAILSPVLLDLSFTKGIHPMYLLVPATSAASYAFILPISTPPNAIVFDKSDMRQREMAFPGFFVTILTNVLLYGFVNTIGEVIFKFNDYDKSCSPG